MSRYKGIEQPDLSSCEEILDEAFYGSVGWLYRELVKEKQEEKEFNDEIIKELKDMIWDTEFGKCISMVDEGVRLGYIENRQSNMPLNIQGEEIINKCTEILNNISEKQQEVSDENSIEESFDCTYNTRKRKDFISIVVELLEETPNMEESFKDDFMIVLEDLSRCLDLKDIKKVSKGGELFIDSILRGDMNTYDDEIDEILVE